MGEFQVAETHDVWAAPGRRWPARAAATTARRLSMLHSLSVRHWRAGIGSDGILAKSRAWRKGDRRADGKTLDSRIKSPRALDRVRACLDHRRGWATAAGDAAGS